MTPGNTPSAATFSSGDTPTGTIVIGDVPGVDYAFLVTEDNEYIVTEDGARIYVDSTDNSVDYDTGDTPNAGTVSSGGNPSAATFTPGDML